MDRLAVHLEAALEVAVDLHELGSLPTDLQFRVVQEGMVVVDRDPPGRVRREIHIMHAHHDFLPHLERLRRATRTRLAAAGG